MKHTKTVTAFVLGISIAVAGSIYGAYQVNLSNPSKSGVVVPQQTPVVEQQKPATATKPVIVDTRNDESNGTECGENCQLERRLNSIEARLSALEKKN